MHVFIHSTFCIFKNTRAIQYQRKKYFYDHDRKAFTKTPYPVQLTMDQYKSNKGLSPTGNTMQSFFEKFGENSLSIPLPQFKDLFMEHAVAPFFVFQLFCVALWFMDEYWYYSLFTLLMLFVFESTVVMQVCIDCAVKLGFKRFPSCLRSLD